MTIWQKQPKEESEEPTGVSPSASAVQRKPAKPKPIPDDALVIIPLRNAVLFPGTISPLAVGRASSVAALQEAARTDSRIGFLLQRDREKNDVGPSDLYWVGSVGETLRHVAVPEAAHHLVVQGQTRFCVREFLDGWPFLVARVAMIETAEQSGAEIEARFLQLKEQAVEAIHLLPNAPEELTSVVEAVTSPGLLADMVANLLDITAEQKQEVLESFDLRRRLDRVLTALGERVEVLRLSKEIGDKTKKEFDERQREHVLREQMRQIRKELGEGEDGAAEIEELKKSIEAAGMPEEALKQARKELKRLERMQEGGGEYSMLRSWLDLVAELPWKAEDAKAIDIAEARRVLDDDHYGLDKVKRRILEYLAVRKLNPEGKSPILCFVGPPGVSKTSLGQ